MKSFTNQRVRHASRKFRIWFSLSLACLGITFVFSILCIRHYRYSVQNVLVLEDIKTRGLKNELQPRLGRYELDALPEYIGTVEQLHYYMVYRQGCSNELCILKMFDSDYDELKRKLQENGTVTIEGPIGKMNESDMVDAICQYVQEHQIQVDTGEKSLEDAVYGYPVLQDWKMGWFDKILNLTGLYLLWIFIFGALGLATVFDNYRPIRNIRNAFPSGRDYTRWIDEEINSEDAIWYPQNRIYITEHYLVALRNDLLFFRRDGITDLQFYMKENYSIGGLTYIVELDVEYHGEIYMISQIAYHDLQRGTIQSYQMEKWDIYCELGMEEKFEQDEMMNE